MQQQNELCKKLGLEAPIFAFTHCRDVVVEVSKAGGIGVLGAVGFSVEQLKAELDWIEDKIGDKPYGVDIVIPEKYEGMGDMDADELEKTLKQMIPQEHHDFAAKLLSDHGVPEWPEGEEDMGLLGWTEATAMPLLNEALSRPGCKLIANALGTPPAHLIKKVQDSGRLIGALCGKVKQGLKHKAAGLDFIIAQGTEGGGHCGEIGSMMLWPQMVDACQPVPVLAAGGIADGRQMAAAMALGCSGIWTGSLWLAVEEAEAEPAEKESYFKAGSDDTVRSRSWTGKPCRVLRNNWSDAWERDDTPEPLGMPLQGLVTADGIRRTKTYASAGQTQDVACNPVGQTVGMINEVETCRGVVFRLLTEYADTIERMNNVIADE